LTGRLGIFGFATAAVAGISSAYWRCRKQRHRRGRSGDRRSILGFAAVAIGISVGGTARHEQRKHQCCDFHDTPPRVRTNEGKSCRCVLRQIGRFTACEINSSIGLLMRSASICGLGEPFAGLSSAGVCRSPQSRGCHHRSRRCGNQRLPSGDYCASARRKPADLPV
jgi:hypothetical protein